MEEINSTETTEEVVESGEQEGVVGSSEEESQKDFDLINTDAPAETEEETDADPAEPVTQQTKEDNHAAKLARLKAEREFREKERKRAEEDDKFFRECGAINPLTEKPFQSRKEFEEYGRKVKEADLKSRAEKDGKTVEEVMEDDEVREEIRKRKQSTTEDPQKTREDRASDDLIEFMEANPEVDVDILVKNQKFIKFCGSRLGKESLTSLYSDYTELVHDAEKAAKTDTRASRSTGSGGNGGDRLTAAQRAALDEWNEANPEMQMTPKEFLTR